MSYIIVSLISLAIGFGLGRVKSKATVAKAEKGLGNLLNEIRTDAKKL